MLPSVSLLLASALLLPAGDGAAGAERTYAVRQTTRLARLDPEAKEVRWWVSIPDDERFQDLLDLKVVSAPGEWRIEREPGRGNRFLYIEAKKPGKAELEAVVEFVLRRQPVLIDVDPANVGALTANHRTIFAEALVLDEPHMEVTPAVADLAKQVCGDEQNPALASWKLLEYVARETDHYSKDATKPRCGIGDVSECLTNAGGCCTDMHSLFIALARARGIPARLQMGYRVQEKNLGKEVDPGYRCWAEYFLPGYGWVPADIVEADAADGLGPQRWFRGLTERRVWLNQGREFTLSPAQAGGPVSTMSIGYAEVDGRPVQLRDEGDAKAQLTRTVLCTEVAPAEQKQAAAGR